MAEMPDIKEDKGKNQYCSIKFAINKINHIKTEKSQESNNCLPSLGHDGFNVHIKTYQ